MPMQSVKSELPVQDDKHSNYFLFVPPTAIQIKGTIRTQWLLLCKPGISAKLANRVVRPDHAESANLGS